MKKQKITTCCLCSKSFEFVSNPARKPKYCSQQCRSAVIASVQKARKTLQDRDCQRCGQTFTPKRSIHLNCPKCRQERVRGYDRTKQCLQCGKTIAPEDPRTVYCSIKCSTVIREQNRKRSVFVKKCPECGKVFEAKRKNQKFCSRRCNALHIVRTQKSKGETSIERSVGQMLSQLHVIAVPQFRIKQWICDFYIPQCNLVIECDGTYWHSIPSSVERDQRKDKWLVSRGYKILRLPEHEIKNAPDICVQKIQQALFE